jgi:hypothetical protein
MQHLTTEMGIRLSCWSLVYWMIVKFIWHLLISTPISDPLASNSMSLCSVTMGTVWSNTRWETKPCSLEPVRPCLYF